MVYILLAAGFEEAEALVPADLLRRAGVEVSLVGVSGMAVTGGRGITVQCDCAMEAVDLNRAEMILLPGGGVGVENLKNTPAVEQLVKQAAEKNLWLSAICAAPTLLAGWGLLDGKNAVCYPTWADRLVGAEYCAGEKVVREGKIITAQAAGAAFEFGLALIEALVDEATAQRVKQEIYL